MDLFDLSGKTAVVTGGNGGIGLAMATGMAEAGASIVVAGRNGEKNANAVAALENYLKCEPGQENGYEASKLLQELRARLN